MKEKYRIKKTQEFEEILNLKNKAYSKSLVIFYRNNSYNYSRFGISVGKKIGKAIIRNKYKRQIRNILQNHLNTSKDYIIILRSNTIKFNDLKEEIDKTIYMINKRKDS